MDFKSLLSQLDQLNEATTKTKTGVKHTAEPGGYGRKDDEDDEEDEEEVVVVEVVVDVVDEVEDEDEDEDENCRQDADDAYGEAEAAEVDLGGGAHPGDERSRVHARGGIDEEHAVGLQLRDGVMVLLVGKHDALNDTGQRRGRARAARVPTLGLGAGAARVVCARGPGRGTPRSGAGSCRRR